MQVEILQEQPYYVQTYNIPLVCILNTEKSGLCTNY